MRWQHALGQQLGHALASQTVSSPSGGLSEVFQHTQWTWHKRLYIHVCASSWLWQALLFPWEFEVHEKIIFPVSDGI